MSSVKPRNGNGSKRRKIPYIGKPPTQAEFYAALGITKRDIAIVNKVLAEVRQKKARAKARKKTSPKKVRATK